MPAHDNRSDQISQLILKEDAIASNGQLDGFVLDTVEFDRGIMFLTLVEAVSGSPDGTATVAVFESDTDFGSPTEVTNSENIIGVQTVFPSAPSTVVTNPAGGVLSAFGIISLKRFVRVSIVTAGRGQGTRSFRVFAVKRSVFTPVPE